MSDTVRSLTVLKRLGGSASIAELRDHVQIDMGLTDEQRSAPHGDSGAQTEVADRRAWALSHLKEVGLVGNSERGVSSLTESGRGDDTPGPRERAEIEEEAVKKRLAGNRELHDYLIQLAASLEQRGADALSRAVTIASRYAFGMNVEFLNESRIALRMVHDFEKGVLTKNERSDLWAVMRQLDRALEQRGAPDESMSDD